MRLPDRLTNRPFLARAALVALPVAACGLVAALTDDPSPAGGPRDGGPPGGRERRAALAVRDDVVPFQKFGTRIFTVPHLAAAYAEAVFVTQYGPHDGAGRIVLALGDLLARYRHVDLFLLTHGRDYTPLVRAVPAARRQHLRLVYNTGCGGAAQARDWLGLGARAYVAHGGTRSLSPFFYFYFLRRWTRGAPLDSAVPAANKRVARIFALGGVASLGAFDPAAWARETEAVVFGDPAVGIGSAP